MGQDLSGHQPELSLEPGTYRIASKLTGTNIQVSDHDHSKVVPWETHNRKNQQWFVQSSGDGYKFKNCQHGNYLAVASTDQHSLVYASRFPTTWVLLKKNDGYLVSYADNNRVLDLHFGWGNNGNEIHIWAAGGDNANKTWKFQRLSDETGEDLPAAFQQRADKLSRELQAETQNSTLKDDRIASLEREIKLLVNHSTQKDRELAEKDATIRQLQRDKEEALSEVQKENEEITCLRGRQAQLESKLFQQETEVAGLQGKMDRVEYIASRMSRSYDKM